MATHVQIRISPRDESELIKTIFILLNVLLPFIFRPFLLVNEFSEV